LWNLYSYFTTMILIFVILMVTTMTAFIYNYKLSLSIYSSMKGSLQVVSIIPELSSKWDDIQAMYGCCGIDSYKDWLPYGIPNSCCELQGTNCTTRTSTINHEALFPIGCYNFIQRQLSTDLNRVGFSSITIALFQIFCIMSSLALFCYLQRRNENFEASEDQ
ncbi:hypothetical protein GJ496_011558, partial [Pomphorhynchus laevis]